MQNYKIMGIVAPYAQTGPRSVVCVDVEGSVVCRKELGVPLLQYGSWLNRMSVLFRVRFKERCAIAALQC